MTSPYKVVFSIVLLLLVGQTAGLAESKPLELKWNELAGVLGGQRLEVVLAGGKSVRGEGISVRQDSLLMDLTSPAAGYPKGGASIPRTSIELIKLHRTRGAWGRGMGTTLGVITGLTVGGYVAGTHTNSAAAGIPLFLGITGAITTGGYYAGKAMDTKVTLIRIVP